MLRTRIRATTASTGVNLSVSHGLGTTLDAWNVVDCSARGLGRTFVAGGIVGIGANRIVINNAVQTTVTVDVFAWVYQGRLY